METQYITNCDAAIAVLTGKFIALNAYIGKDGKSQINTVSFHIQERKRPN